VSAERGPGRRHHAQDAEHRWETWRRRAWLGGCEHQAGARDRQAGEGGLRSRQQAGEPGLRSRQRGERAGERGGRPQQRGERAGARDPETGRPGTRADSRDALAMEREKEIGLREKWLAEREREVGLRETWLAERERLLRDDVEAVLQRMLETIERSRASLAAEWGLRASGRDGAPEAPGGQGGRRRLPHGETGFIPLAPLPDLRESIDRALALRWQAVAAIASFAATEEKIARLHEDLAARWPARAKEYRRVADVARTAAQRAREIVAKYQALDGGQG
jgi:hypothetical protein